MRARSYAFDNFDQNSSPYTIQDIDDGSLSDANVIQTVMQTVNFTLTPKVAGRKGLRNIQLCVRGYCVCDCQSVTELVRCCELIFVNDLRGCISVLENNLLLFT